MCFGGITPIPISLGANVVGLIAQDKQNVMGVRCYMEAPHVLRRTTAHLLPVCRLARQDRGCARVGFQFSPQENEGKALSPYPDYLRLLPRHGAPMGGGGG